MAHFVPSRTRVEDAFILALPEHAAKWRHDAMARFAEKGLPHRRMESWRYTDLRAKLKEPPILKTQAAAAPSDAAQAVAALNLGDAIKCVFIDGVFAADLSDLKHLPAGLSIRPLGDGDDDPAADWRDQDEGDAIVALNAALASSGVAMTVADGARIPHSIALVSFASTGEARATFSRNVIRIGKGAFARILEIRAPGGSGFQAHEALFLSLADDAEAELISRVTGEKSIQLHSLLVTLRARARFTATHCIADADVTRRQIFARLAGEKAVLNLRGLSLLAQEQHADATLVVDHVAPFCESREFFRHILQDRAVGVFQGRISVQKEAQKTDGAMKSHALLLDDGVAMYNKPELEIFADDVVCGHGATVGALDEKQIFYLMSRGLPFAEAEDLLLEAFAQETLEDVGDEAARAHLRKDVSLWLAQRRRK